MTGRLTLSFRHCQARQQFVTVENNTCARWETCNQIFCKRVADRQHVPTTLHHQGFRVPRSSKNASKGGLSPWSSKPLQRRMTPISNQIYQVAPLSVPKNKEYSQFFGVPTSQCLHWLGTPKNWGRRVATGQVIQDLPSPTAYLLTIYLVHHQSTPDRGHLFNSAVNTQSVYTREKRRVLWPQTWFKDSIKTPNSRRKEELNHVWFESFDKNSLYVSPAFGWWTS